MISLPTIPSDGFSSINDLYLENFYLGIDKINLEIEVKELRLMLDMYKSLAKQYQDLYFSK
jgi:hypothetical protein